MTHPNVNSFYYIWNLEKPVGELQLIFQFFFPLILLYHPLCYNLMETAVIKYHYAFVHAILFIWNSSSIFPFSPQISAIQLTFLSFSQQQRTWLNTNLCLHFFFIRISKKYTLAFSHTPKQLFLVSFCGSTYSNVLSKKMLNTVVSQGPHLRLPLL